MTVIETDPRIEISKLKSEVAQLKMEIETLEAQLQGGDIPKATAWLQMKVWRQRKALDALNRTVVTNRFIVRTLNEMGRGLSREEYLEARSKQPDLLQARIEE
jgi:hypothetical protein